ncbi:MAG: tetratricopeptide repeat protein [Colwellia sp.]|nr:tetratricopeptide repeat protein [Colwellia sp.]
MLKLSLTTLFSICYLLTSHLSFAYEQDDSIDEQLIVLAQLTDKHLVIEKLNQLLSSTEITPKQYVATLNLQGRSYLAVDNFDEAINVLQQAQVIAQSQQLPQLEANAYKLLGISYYYQGKLSDAILVYQASLSFYREIDAPIKQANLLNNLALVYSSMGDYSLALKNYQLAKSLYQSYGSDEDQLDVRYNIALIHVNMRRYGIAIKMLLEVMSKRETMNDEYSLALVWADLGNAYKHAKQYQLAKKYLHDALDYFQLHNNRHHIASQLHNVAELYHQLGKPDTAQIYAEKSIEISVAIGHKKAYAGSLNSLAKSLFSQGKIEQSLQKIILANQVARQSGYKALLNSNQALLALIYATQNNTSEALTTHLSYINKQNERENELFNMQLARFESEQLSQQVEQLTQNEKLQQLQTKQSTQQQYLVVVAVIFILFIIFFIFRRNIEKSLKKALEVKVKQRTQELEFLMQELQRANKVKSRFFTNMTSDIKAPLTLVIEQSELILKQNVSTKSINKDVEFILGNGLHLLQLINDILDLGKIEANTLELELKQQDLNIILNEIFEMFNKQAKIKGLTFEINNPLSSPFIVNIDALRLKQVLINFCTNAVKFTDKGKIMLSVTQLNNELKFSVMDTGVGMNKVQLKQIFDSFNQGDSNSNRRLGATGLGLFISEQLASIMGGNISAQSTLHQGSTFTFTLPISTTKNQ